MSVFDCYSKACSNGIQHHATLLDATCWPRLNTMLEDVGMSLNLLKMLSMLNRPLNVACNVLSPT